MYAYMCSYRVMKDFNACFQKGCFCRIGHSYDLVPLLNGSRTNSHNYVSDLKKLEFSNLWIFGFGN